jgi:hypothetical protein
MWIHDKPSGAMGYVVSMALAICGGFVGAGLFALAERCFSNGSTYAVHGAFAGVVGCGMCVASGGSDVWWAVIGIAGSVVGGIVGGLFGRRRRIAL